MADSENSTSLPGVTRRAMLTSGGVLSLAPFVGAPPWPTREEVDHILSLWRDWQRADKEATRWCHEWQRLESALIRAVGMPRVLVRLPAAADGLWVTTHEAIEDELGDGDEDVRATLHAELAARQSRWNVAADRVGLDALSEREAASWRRKEELGRAIFAQPATSLAGVAAKLAVVLQIGESRAGDPEFPWPEIRSALSDLCRWTSKADGGGWVSEARAEK